MRAVCTVKVTVRLSNFHIRTVHLIYIIKVYIIIITIFTFVPCILYTLLKYIQGDSGGICITLGNDSMSDSK